MSNSTSIRISSGRYVDLDNFTSEDVCLESIEKSLNNLYRFTGHYQNTLPLTVAQHTALVMKISKTIYPTDEATFLLSLLHDFPESYYGDLSSPLKQHLGDSYRSKIKLIDNTLIDTLWYLKESPSAQTYEQMKICDHISLRIEQTKLWGDYRCNENDELEINVRQFIKDNDTKSWFEDMADRHIALQNTYAVLKSKHVS